MTGRRSSRTLSRIIPWWQVIGSNVKRGMASLHCLFAFRRSFENVLIYHVSWLFAIKKESGTLTEYSSFPFALTANLRHLPEFCSLLTFRFAPTTNLPIVTARPTWGQFNKTFTLVIYKLDPLCLQAQTKTSRINIVTSPFYKLPTCNYRCSSSPEKCGRHPI